MFSGMSDNPLLEKLASTTGGSRRASFWMSLAALFPIPRCTMCRQAVCLPRGLKSEPFLVVSVYCTYILCTTATESSETFVKNRYVFDEECECEEEEEGFVSGVTREALEPLLR